MKDTTLLAPVPALLLLVEMLVMGDSATAAGADVPGPPSVITIYKQPELGGAWEVEGDGRPFREGGADLKGSFAFIRATVTKPGGPADRAWEVTLLGYSVKERIREQVEYPPLAEGELVPMLGYIYRVGKLNGGRGGRAVEFHLVPKEEIPPGVAPQPDSFVMPLMRFNSGGRTRLHDVASLLEAFKDPRKPYSGKYTDIWVVKIDASQESDKGPVAALSLGGRTFPEHLTSQVRAGDVLMVRDNGHKVRKIVPPDDKTGVIGWVELDWRPIVGEELAKQPRVVRLKLK